MSARVDAIDIRDRLRWRATADEFEEIRGLWISHSKAEDARDLDGLIATLAPDCVYELPWEGHRWEGHEGARRFYTELLGAFPDIRFDLLDIVIGPQGVFEYADVTAVHSGGPWLGVEPDGQAKRWFNTIFFPWDPDARRFAGEKVYTSPGAPGRSS